MATRIVRRLGTRSELCGFDREWAQMLRVVVEPRLPASSLFELRLCSLIKSQRSFMFSTLALELCDRGKTLVVWSWNVGKGAGESALAMRLRS